ncbi:Aspartate/glutamate/uridylate kinase [Lipomyces tetrasporus]|uniref:Aspartate/glutamate/uridylate kinase n=1 Tax=Lipomyces tetrasporus TaxID=54092 RepID=A0AAD7VRC6_9ASCO|nr:Aspartate/glutamate/uridylate kinase [Lipomyces tetrasporus]KAJ8099862.1 Aspartate/glutamate/uridylate kinase [Lipomyces tetrasporus]
MKHKDQRPLTIVIKLGTSSICDEVTHEPGIANMSLIVETVVKLRREGHRVIIVSSAAIAMGLKRLDIPKRPKHLATVQAIAAVGQCRLIALWDELFRQLNQPVAQILLTRNDIADRAQYLNAANTLLELLHMGVIPIVNENDTLSVMEIKFGDNDTLSAITAGMVNADYLFLMTDVDGLYTENPRNNPDALPIEVVKDISQLTVDVSTGGSSVGTGGMVTKLVAAELATSAGITTIITKSSVPGNIRGIIKYLRYLKGQEGERNTSDKSINPTVPSDLSVSDPDIRLSARSITPLAPTDSVARDSPSPSRTPCRTPSPPPRHTRFLPQSHPMRDRLFWILHGLKSHGAVYIDTGAYKAITRANRAGLLPAGVVDVKGTFSASEAVSLVVIDRKTLANAEKDVQGGGDANKAVRAAILEEGEVVGKAIVNYSSVEIARIMGLKSSEIESLLGYSDSEYIAHRDNLAFAPKHL